MEKLKPCPFCGGKAVLHVKNGVRIVCQDCETSTISLVDGESQGKPTSGAVNSVIQKWNKRIGSTYAEQCRHYVEKKQREA